MLIPERPSRKQSVDYVVDMSGLISADERSLDLCRYCASTSNESLKEYQHRTAGLLRLRAPSRARDVRGAKISLRR